MKKRRDKKSKNKSFIKHEAFEDFNISSLQDHKRDGNKLLSPFSKIGNIKSFHLGLTMH